MSAKHLASKNIKRLRQDAGLTQEGLAKKCGLSVRYVWHLENASANTTLDTLEAVARGLGCELVDLLSDPTARRDRPPKNTLTGIEYVVRLLNNLREQG